MFCFFSSLHWMHKLYQYRGKPQINTKHNRVDKKWFIIQSFLLILFYLILRTLYSRDWKALNILKDEMCCWYRYASQQHTFIDMHTHAHSVWQSVCLKGRQECCTIRSSACLIPLLQISHADNPQKFHGSDTKLCMYAFSCIWSASWCI